MIGRSLSEWRWTMDARESKMSATLLSGRSSSSGPRAIGIESGWRCGNARNLLDSRSISNDPGGNGRASRLGTLRYLTDCEKKNLRCQRRPCRERTTAYCSFLFLCLILPCLLSDPFFEFTPCGEPLSHRHFSRRQPWPSIYVINQAHPNAMNTIIHYDEW